MPKFTPGRWMVAHSYSNTKFPREKTMIETMDRADPLEIASLTRNNNAITKEERDTNARLIAEAPVMYNLLSKAFHILGKNGICREIDECLSRVDGVPAHDEEPETTAQSLQGVWQANVDHGAIDIVPTGDPNNEIVTVYDMSEEGYAVARPLTAETIRVTI